MSDYNPLTEGRFFTKVASATITGGQLLSVSGDGTVAPSAVTDKTVLGVAGHDQISGGLVTMYDLQFEHLTTVAASETLTAGNPVKAGAAGTIQEWVDGTDDMQALLGVCTVGAAAGDLATWKGR